MKLLLSSYSLEPFPLEEIFLLASDLKADGLELILTPAVYWLGLKNIKELSDRHQVPVLNVHQPPWGIIFTGKRGIRMLLAKAKFLGAQNIVVHLATMRRSFNSRFFEWIKAQEKETGISISFENGAPRFFEKWPSYAAQPAELEKFAKARDIHLTLDVSKLHLAGEDPYQFFQRNRTHISAMHFHGFDGDDYHVGFNGRDFDWSGFMSFVKKYSYEGTVTLEVFPMQKWVYVNLPSREKLASTKELIEENFRILRRA